MSNKLKIDERLLNEIEKLKQINQKMEQLFEEVKNKEKELEITWSGHSKEVAAKEFEKMFKQFEQIKKSNLAYIDYLEKKVYESYAELSSSIISSINSNL